MIASLWLIIILRCGVPYAVLAEQHGETRDYLITRYEEINGQLQYEVGKDTDREFLGAVQGEMAARRMPPIVKNRDYACHGA